MAYFLKYFKHVGKYLIIVKWYLDWTYGFAEIFPMLILFDKD